MEVQKFQKSVFVIPYISGGHTMRAQRDDFIIEPGQAGLGFLRMTGSNVELWSRGAVTSRLPDLPGTVFFMSTVSGITLFCPAVMFLATKIRSQYRFA